MCDYGRGTFETYERQPRLAAPRVRRDGETSPASWSDALAEVRDRLRAAGSGRGAAILGSGNLSTEEAFLLARIADAAGVADRPLAVSDGPERHIPNLQGGVTGREAQPNRRGAELAGLGGGIAASDLLDGDAAARLSLLVVADSDFGPGAHDADTVARLRKADFLVVIGWADTPLARAADVALPVATHAEKDGTFVNVENRLQRFEQAFPAPGQVRPAAEVLSELLGGFEDEWAAFADAGTEAARQAFARLATTVPALAGLDFDLPPTGTALDAAGGRKAATEVAG
jgi:predicted molibdopterin-dependent oxidoreductase YjgC